MGAISHGNQYASVRQPQNVRSLQSCKSFKFDENNKFFHNYSKKNLEAKN